MRGLLFILLSLSACTTTAIEDGPDPASLRAHLEREDMTLALAQAESGGTIRAFYKSSDGWAGGLTDLAITDGELVLGATSNGTVQLEHLAIAIAPIDIPENVLGYPAQLTEIEIGIARPVVVSTTWAGDDFASGPLTLDAELTWSFSSHGDTAPLGSPDLPPVPAELVLGGNGSFASAELRVSTTGELWSWASVLRLEDLSLTLLATTPISH